ncbi:hypothetical protein N7468_010016 [Penicillium chermesinum]|uniref:NAD(P)-binding protein n=1 Tax=Penicillium chermesinum TaxID=63820 RepID=A0A9W9TBV9_9EURO|nr:uncharacterized protein N7468_010016 [Penicillium chermesinum]KAJ5217008.1 hypothetical protein N7468_010016 [Penicillium chermesinum]
MSPTLGQLNSNHFTNFVSNLHTEPYAAIDPTKAKLSSPYIVCIIGGSGAAGGGLARAYARAGASGVILAARSVPKLEEVAKEVRSINPSAKVIVTKCDASSDEDNAKLAETVKSEFSGRLDAVVVNAGYSGPMIPDVVQEAPSDFQNSFDVNVVGPFLAAHYLLPLLMASEKGAKSFITISSIMASRVSGPYVHVSYAVSKAAMTRLTEMIHEQYGSRGLFSASVHPGGMVSDLAKVAPPEVLPFLVDSPDLVGAFTVWLSKTDAPQAQRDALTGRFLSCKWDVSELEGKYNEILEKDLLKFRVAVD